MSLISKNKVDKIQVLCEDIGMFKWFKAPRKYRAGGLLPSLPRLSHNLAVPPAWEYPEYIDGRPYLMAADDQGKSSACSGFGMTGILEAIAWWRTGKKVMIDASNFYAEEKKRDQDPQEGATLETAIRTARELGYLEGVEVYDVESELDFRYAMHKFPMVLLGLNITDGWTHVDRKGMIGEGTKKLGGHCIIGDYYDDAKIDVTNSWGRSWGLNGKAYLTWAQFRKQLMSAKGFAFKT
jgi:hypothetical protein